MKRMGSVFLVALTLVVMLMQLGMVQAQQSKNSRISLVADHVAFDPVSQILIAKGNVQIFRDNQVLTTDSLVYDQRKGRITVPGPLTIVSGKVLTTRAHSAVLDANLENGLIRGAEILIGQQLQLVAEEFHRTDGRFKILTKTVASSCRVCKNNPIPFWQIRSRRVIHDELERRLYFENATLQVLGVPVFHTPKLRIPDPTVNRATGFLVPKFTESSTLGFGAEIPYYLTLGDHADLTLTPELYSRGSVLINADYRKRFKRGWVDIKTEFTLADSLTSRAMRSSISAEGHLDLPNDFKLDFGIEASSDKAFRNDYQIGDHEQDRLTSFAILQRTRENSYISLSTAYIQSLRLVEIDTQIPLVLPEIYARKTWNEPYFGGKLGLTAQSVTLLRNNDNKFFRAGLNIDWQREWTFRNGLKVSAYGGLVNNVYTTRNYPPGLINASYSESIPTAALDFRLPLARQSGRVTHVIEPRLQLVWAPKSGRTNPNEDSVQVEFEENNLFSYNRFPGFDKTERGAHANIGISYTRFDPNGWNLGVTVGQVLRFDNLGQFSTGTGLNGVNSDFVSAFNISYQDKFDFVNRMLFDKNFDLSKNEAQLTLNFDRLTAQSTYVWLEKDVVAGASDRRHEASLAAVFQHDDYWSYSAEWRHNFVTNRPTSGAFGLKYENECVAVNLSLSLQFEGSGIVRPTKELGLTVELAGFGNKKRNKRYAHKCSVL